jgi:HTH DNA binding domain
MQEDEENFFRPVWETEDDETLEPPGPPRARKPAAQVDYNYPLLMPLARAQDAVARLEARAAAVSPPVADGLRARMSFREASGWLAHAHVWIHPQDLALRDNGLTGSYGVAFRGDHLETELPLTVAQNSEFEAAPSDIIVDQALRLARSWRRLAEFRTWRPVADVPAVQETLQSLGYRGPTTAADIADWLASVDLQEGGPALIRACRAGRDWMNRPGVKPRNPDAMFLAACLWRAKGYGTPIALPFWSAPEQRHFRLESRTGLAWTADCLDCIAAAAQNGLKELDRLQQAEGKGRLLDRTARSRLPAALQAVLRAPIVTARDLAAMLNVSPQAALGLLRQLVEAGILREATGRASWRAFAVI